MDFPPVPLWLVKSPPCVTRAWHQCDVNHRLQWHHGVQSLPGTWILGWRGGSRSPCSRNLSRQCTKHGSSLFGYGDINVQLEAQVSKQTLEKAWTGSPCIVINLPIITAKWYMHFKVHNSTSKGTNKSGFFFCRRSDTQSNGKGLPLVDSTAPPERAFLLWKSMEIFWLLLFIWILQVWSLWKDIAINFRSGSMSVASLVLVAINL